MKLFAALENQDVANEVSLTTKATENEITVYANIGDAEGFKQALNKTRHTDYLAKFEKDGCKARVRVVETEDSKRLEYTIKIKNPGDEGAVASSTEYTIEVDEAFLEGFKSIAEAPIVKDRYVFETKEVTITVGEEKTKTIQVEGIIYEVDVFEKNTTQCKIDIEIDKVLEVIKDVSPGAKVNILAKVSHLPFKPTGVFSSFSGGKDKLGAFWDTVKGVQKEEEPVEVASKEPKESEVA